MPLFLTYLIPEAASSFYGCDVLFSRRGFRFSPPQKVKGPFSPPSTTTDPAPLGGRIGGSTPISTRGIRKTGCSHLETRPWAVFSPFRALFAVFHGPTPLTCAARGRWAVKTAVGAKETRPVRELCSDWPKTLMGRRYPPKHGALHSKPLSRPPRRSMLRRVRTGGRK